MNFKNLRENLVYSMTQEYSKYIKRVEIKPIDTFTGNSGHIGPNGLCKDRITKANGYDIKEYSVIFYGNTEYHFVNARKVVKNSYFLGKTAVYDDTWVHVPNDFKGDLVEFITKERKHHQKLNEENFNAVLKAIKGKEDEEVQIDIFFEYNYPTTCINGDGTRCNEREFRQTHSYGKDEIGNLIDYYYERIYKGYVLETTGSFDINRNDLEKILMSLKEKLITASDEKLCNLICCGDFNATANTVAGNEDEYKEFKEENDGQIDCYGCDVDCAEYFCDFEGAKAVYAKWDFIESIFCVLMQGETLQDMLDKAKTCPWKDVEAIYLDVISIIYRNNL